MIVSQSVSQLVSFLLPSKWDIRHHSVQGEGERREKGEEGRGKGEGRRGRGGERRERGEREGRRGRGKGEGGGGGSIHDCTYIYSLHTGPEFLLHDCCACTLRL